jgi:EcsC protein family
VQRDENGAGTGVAGIVALPADLALLAWIQSRLVLSIAAAYGHDMTDHKERAAKLLVIQGVHAGIEVARRKLEGVAMRAATTNPETRPEAGADARQTAIRGRGNQVHP